ncbi:hypothetical protein [Allosediminivita pacifica]|uniref:hypothetical protein n=1 Tax=Allosediminivita pacifica TaxID=1267769 RepID=UPI0011B20D2D|nr:hypothetical protein [Allosediminivita pacifica]GGB00396.1 hypothetical protein GCM10011324_08300 [Allosediminivita pacifica]
MKKRLLAALFLLISANAAVAQELGDTDRSRYELFEEGETVTTLADLEKMEDAYMVLVGDGKCEAALPEMVEFYEAANHVSNLIRRGNEPYYDAGRDDREIVARNRSLLNELISA